MSESIQAPILPDQCGARPGIGTVTETETVPVAFTRRQRDLDRNLAVGTGLFAQDMHVHGCKIIGIAERVLQVQQPARIVGIARLERHIPVQERGLHEILDEGYLAKVITQAGIEVQFDVGPVMRWIHLQHTVGETGIYVALMRSQILKPLLYVFVDRLVELVTGFERQLIAEMLERNGFNLGKTAEQLKISRHALRYRMQRLNLTLPGESDEEKTAAGKEVSQ